MASPALVWCLVSGGVSLLLQIEELFNLEIKGFDGLVINVSQAHTAQPRQLRSASEINTDCQ